MNFLYQLLAFCAFVGLMNFLGFGPQYDEPMEVWKGANRTKKILMGIYAVVCFIGDLTIGSTIIYIFFFN